ncbi:MAG TPA: hypothetical protein VM146_02855 [Steroidobacteraceae bacterium]|nr:hypothetical protein [Steroidobacteraceae bacterium]
MPLLALLVSIPLGDMLSKLPRAKQQVPQAYDEATRLPGKPPAAVADLYGAWEMDYSEDDVTIESFNVDLVVKLVVRFDADGTYHLQYNGRWGKGKEARGVTVDESGSFKISSDVLILDPTEVTKTDIERNKPVSSLGLANEKHLLVVHRETKRIHLAGKCASYQVDPICKDWQIENVWFTFKGPQTLKFGH